MCAHLIFVQCELRPFLELWLALPGAGGDAALFPSSAVGPGERAAGEGEGAAEGCCF